METIRDRFTWRGPFEEGWEAWHAARDNGYVVPNTSNLPRGPGYDVPEGA
jgi:hypothetical protein